MALEMKRDRKRSTNPDTSRRSRILKKTETSLLVKCRRRCALCYGLQHKLDEAKGQIAHINHDRSDSAEENLAYLCMPHHDEYDSTTSQSKGITPGELLQWKEKLERIVELENADGRYEADVTIDVDFETFSDTAVDAFAKAITKLVDAKHSVVVVSRRRGSVILLLEMESSDIRSFCIAYDFGKLDELKVTSIKVLGMIDGRDIKFIPGWGTLDTATQSLAFKLDRQADKATFINIDRYNVRFAARFSRSNPDVVAIVWSVYDGAEVTFAEPIVFQIDTASESPYNMLQKFLAKNEVLLFQIGHEPIHAIINRVITTPFLIPNFNSNEFLVWLERSIETSPTLLGEFHWAIRREGANVRIIFMYFLKHDAKLQMRRLSGKQVWF